jgi:hypothetical protein
MKLIIAQIVRSFALAVVPAYIIGPHGWRKRGAHRADLPGPPTGARARTPG